MSVPSGLVLVGWYCWRCRNVNLAACRSDGVPVWVPGEWAAEMRAELERRESGGDEPGAVVGFVGEAYSPRW